MQPVVAEKLIRLNQEFYQTFGAAFSRTRLRIQPGVRKFLQSVPAQGTWLDLGCGNGYLAREWTRNGFQGSYIGLDNSDVLLNEARILNKDIDHARFHLWDLSSGTFPHRVIPRDVHGIMAFAVLHHLPGRQNRLALLRAINDLLSENGTFAHSVWQFQRSSKFLARVQPWSRAGLTDEVVDPGDHLLDWRYALPGQAEQRGLRYVHSYTADELRNLAGESGFRITEEWFSDGQGGDLSLYQVWRKI